MTAEPLMTNWSIEDLQRRAKQHYDTTKWFAPERYTSREFMNLERDRLWSETWLIATHTSALREVGDYVEFKAAGESMLIVRQRDGEIAAISNVCRHRATCLRAGAGNAAEFRCPFHGWRYDLDGTLLERVNAWDFPGRDDPGLPRFPVNVWNEFVFVSISAHPEPFDEFLGPLKGDLEHWEMSSRWRKAAVRTILPCNWKVAAAAFPETYHVPWTHPQIARCLSDVDLITQPLGRHGKLFTECRPSPNVFPATDDETFIEELLEFRGSEVVDRALGLVQEGMSAREAVTQIRRESCAAIGYDFDDRPESEIIDGVGYWIYPNVVTYPGLSGPGHVMLFSPNGDDPDTCVFEMWMLPLIDKTKEPPAGVDVLEFPQGTSMDDVLRPHMGDGPLGQIFDQDVSNLASIQQGLKSRFFPGISFAGYQESLLRNFEEHLDRQLGLDRAQH